MNINISENISRRLKNIGYKTVNGKEYNVIKYYIGENIIKIFGSNEIELQSINFITTKDAIIVSTDYHKDLVIKLDEIEGKMMIAGYIEDELMFTIYYDMNKCINELVFSEFNKYKYEIDYKSDSAEYYAEENGFIYYGKVSSLNSNDRGNEIYYLTTFIPKDNRNIFEKLASGFKKDDLVLISANYFTDVTLNLDVVFNSLKMAAIKERKEKKLSK